MRKLMLFLSSCVFLFGSSALVAQDSGSAGNLPSIIRAGLEAYKSSGPQAAVQAWVKGSPIDGSQEALNQENVLNQIQNFYGAYQSFDLINTHDLTPRIKIFYLALDLEKGPLFAKFVVYRSGSTWILTYFNFNTKEDAILPTLP